MLNNNSELNEVRSADW